ncbi:MAG: hypothetical protein Q4F24_17655 [Eubacteriales bacterium]|nr:hypothetical protein [Eubacteriales bacterium]
MESRGMDEVLKSGEKLVPLDIVLDYPVNWEFWKVLRDLIQNFYDSIGYKNFKQEFEYHSMLEADGRITLVMKTRNHPFSYEWLTYLGGSTKTGKDDFIGNYGEGFKVCMLCLMRMECQVTMESQDWKLSPCVYSREIDGKQLDMLGYQVSKRYDDGNTILTVCGIDSCYKNEIQEGMLNFFYPENPLVGEKIVETDTYAIYGRSDVPVPCDDWNADIIGILFFRYLARGRLPFPLIILLKRYCDYSEEKRARNLLKNYQITEMLYWMAELMRAEDSYMLLIRLKYYWDELPKISKENRMDITTWYYVICQLVRNVSQDEELCTRFRKEYPNLIYLERISSDIVQNRKIKAAREWYWIQKRKEWIVNPVFRLLGVPSLLEMHRKDEENNVYKQPTQKQRRLWELLETAYRITVPNSVIQGEEPPGLLICEHYKGSPMAFAKRIYVPAFEGGRKRKYKIEKIVMEESGFYGNFYEIFLKYSEARFRAFGTDRSRGMASLLTCLGGWMMNQSEELKKICICWEEIAHED